MKLSTNLRNGILGLSSLGLCAGITSCAKQAEQKVERPNFVFVLIDDMGWTDLGCFGSSFYETPNIDKLASEGVKFTNAYAACPVCSPTRASIMSGKYPARIDVTDWIPGRQHRGARDYEKMIQKPFKLEMGLEEVTVAEALKEEGYKTCFIGKWHIGESEEYWPHHQGFDVNIAGWSKGSPQRNKNANGYFSPYGNPMIEDGPKGEYLTDRLTDEAIKYIEGHKDNPFFVYLSYYTVHNPLMGKKELIEKFKKKAEDQGLDKKEHYTRDKAWIKEKPKKSNYKERLFQDQPTYSSMIYSLDENIGKLTAKLKELGLDKNTVIFFMSDNGGLSTSEGSPTCNDPLRGGKGWLYEGGVREPMFVKWPGVAKAGTEIDVPVTSTDFYPTILEMAGAPLKQDQHVDGKSFAGLLKGEQANGERPLYWHYPHYSNQGTTPGAAIRLGDYKLIEYFEDNHVELYNLKDDVGETKDLAADMPEKTNELKQMLHQWQKEVGAKFPDPNPDYDPSVVANSWK
ncbi:DUF4976 domain-containing protein [Puteibacter caeruleilacunae]|nr:DUF4976 domain-containing protein [Puteibacter caeruleilacunae]